MITFNIDINKVINMLVRFLLNCYIFIAKYACYNYHIPGKKYETDNKENNYNNSHMYDSYELLVANYEKEYYESQRPLYESDDELDKKNNDNDTFVDTIYIDNEERYSKNNSTNNNNYICNYCTRNITGSIFMYNDNKFCKSICRNSYMRREENYTKNRQSMSFSI